MSSPVRGKLLWKLVTIHVVVLLGLVGAIWMTIDFRAAGYFTDLMREYNVSPSTLHEMFLDAVHRYLVWVSLVGILIAVAVNLLWVRRLLRPLTKMAETAERIAAGDYSDRVPVRSSDEVADVARSFNRMADSLARIEHLRQNLVTDVAHELRTPLGNIQGYLEGLRDGVISPSQETFASLHEETVRLSNLVKSLLRLASADAAKATLRLEPLSSREWLGSILALFQHRFEAKRISVRLDIDGDVDAFRGDRDKLTQVVRNLLENAWRYTEEGGDVVIRCERRSGKTRLSFENSGPGIAAEDLPHVFERFYRGEKSRSRELGGEGIGLAIVREVVEAHGGEVGAESGSGRTSVWLDLPG